MNLPNKLTLFRIILVPFLVAALLLDFNHHYLVVGIIFSIASFTDFLDGQIARKKQLITNFGKFADPLADKILVISVLLCFIELRLISCIMVIIVIAREFLVTSIRLVASCEGKVIAANNFGKAKTISQIVAIILVVILQYILELITMGTISTSISTYLYLANIFNIIGAVALWISTVFTVISGIIYLKDNVDVIADM